MCIKLMQILVVLIYGFSVGIAGDIKGSNTKSNTTQTTSISSNLIANNNINIDTKDLNLTPNPPSNPNPKT
ncbi:hypothetical protein [Campylobacter majalis]|uniref:hypothetical protein n=1 Tax=Campylobacter majalis TaxID=2790656 RepID=UPI003D6902AA